MCHPLTTWQQDETHSQIQNNNFKHLPDEIMLKIISFLDITNPRDMTCLKALGLTCRRLRDLTYDQNTIKKMIQSQGWRLTNLYPTTIWTPRTLWRYSKALHQMAVCVKKLGGMWEAMGGSPRLPIRNRGVVTKGVMGIMKIDGLEDNAPNYALLNQYTNHELVAMLATALMYQEIFLHRYYVLVADLKLAQMKAFIKKVLIFIFLTKGPHVAMCILEKPFGVREPFQISSWLESRIRRDSRPGQEIIFVGSNKTHGHLPQVLWGLQDAIGDYKESNSRNLASTARIDLRVVRRMPRIILDWCYHGRGQTYFDNPELDEFGQRGAQSFRRDLVNCLRVWKARNPLS